jgi:hypothetical protein
VIKLTCGRKPDKFGYNSEGARIVHLKKILYKGHGNYSLHNFESVSYLFNTAIMVNKVENQKHIFFIYKEKQLLL